MSKRGLARIGDRTLGTCSHPDHEDPIIVGGTIITGSPNMEADGKRAVARLDDQVRTDCGHSDFIITTSATIVNDSGLVKKVARLGDRVGRNGIYVADIITASSKIFGDL